MKVLVADDDLLTRNLLSSGLTESGHECVAASDGLEALEHLAADADGFDLLLLDVMMPRCDGWEVLERLRARGSRVPVVMLTARHEVSERVKGLEAGADDYLIKPFAWSELRARIEAVRRRSQRSLRVGELEIDLEDRVVRCGKLRIELSPREFALLVCLARETSGVLSRKQLLERVWGIDFDPGSNMLDVAISRLRRRLLCTRSVTIESVTGHGYVLRVEGRTPARER